LSAASWLLFLGVYLVQMSRYTSRHEWMVRFPVVFICAGETAKLRWLPWVDDVECGTRLGSECRLRVRKSSNMVGFLHPVFRRIR